MSTERDTVITRLSRDMKESPLPVPAQCRPERRVLVDGYVRQTLEQPLVMTDKYRHRTSRAILRWLIIVTIVAFLAVAVIKAGIISI